ncbi:MAG: complex I NDUFA9 subunit family protein [Betaproteobacteria bacterium]
MKHRRVVVLGGSGFVGRHVVSRLVDQDCEVVIPTRRRERGKQLAMLPRVEVYELDVRDVAAVGAVTRDADAVINLVGILNESRGISFDDAHVKVTEAAIHACRANGIARFVQMSALNVEPAAPSAYLRTKALAEARVAASGLAWSIFQPSVIFGPEDRFLNLFARLAGIFPLIFLAGANARFQPVYVGDVAAAITTALDDDRCCNARFALCGPNVYTLRELVAYAAQMTGRRPLIVGLPNALAQIQAWLLERLPGEKLLTRDNLASMRVDSVCDEPWPAVFGSPSAIEDMAPRYMRPAQADPIALIRQRHR